MAHLRRHLCRHDFEVVERIDEGGDARMEISVLRCSKCCKERIVAEGGRPPVGQGDLRRGSVRRP